MLAKNSETRVVLKLDSRVALEAIILNRLERTPKGRRQEWLRGLLVGGFRFECQILQSSMHSQVSSKTNRSFTWNPPTLKPTAPSEPSKPADYASPHLTSNADKKPLAMLARVIGHDAPGQLTLVR